VTFAESGGVRTRNEYAAGGIVELTAEEEDKEYCTIPDCYDNYCTPGPAEIDENKEYCELEQADQSASSPYYLSLQNEYAA